LPSDYPDPADSDALVEWGAKTQLPRDVRALLTGKCQPDKLRHAGSGTLPWASVPE